MISKTIGCRRGLAYFQTNPWLGLARRPSTTRQKFAFPPYNLSWALFIWILLGLSMISVLACLDADFDGDVDNRNLIELDDGKILTGKPYI